MEEETKELKKKIMEEWLNEFPQFSAFSQNKLYKIVSCCVIGIELIKLPHSEEYRPYFVIYPLWKNDIKSCLDVPVLMKEFYNKKGLQFNIPYSRHNVYFMDVVSRIKEQHYSLIEENGTLESLFEFVSSCFGDILVRSNSAQQAKLFELEFHAALYVGNQTQIQNVLSQIKKESKNWNMQMFEFWNGKYELWFQSLQEKFNDQTVFFKQVENNKQDRKMKGLNCSDFTF
jgi:hypothetical protein